jgi:hypothetical protein
MTIVSLVKATKAIDQKQNPVFKLQKKKKKKKLSQTQFQNNRNDFLKAIKDHLNHLETSSSTLIAPDTLQVNNNPHTSTSHINIIQNHQTQNSDEDAL